MEYLSKIQRWCDYYKGRYDKAVSMQLPEGSRHYAAFQEIERRYAALQMAIEFLDTLPYALENGQAESISQGFILFILDSLFLGEVIRNEEGKKEYIRQRIVIQKSDTKKCQMFRAAEEAKLRISQMDFSADDPDVAFSDMAENLYYLLQWCLVAREMFISVEKKESAGCTL
jgi:hypothetical protein